MKRSDVTLESSSTWCSNSTSSSSIGSSSEDEEDVYGQVHPFETPELIASTQREFESELRSLPCSETFYVEEAEDRCPELLTNDFKLLFLRSERFCAKVSETVSASLFHKTSRDFVASDETSSLILYIGYSQFQ